MTKPKVPRRGLGLLVCLLIVTGWAALTIPQPAQAVLLALGVAAVAAEFTSAGNRVAEIALRLASLIFPAEVGRVYYTMWRGDLYEARGGCGGVDRQGPISFSLDVLVSAPRSAFTEWWASPARAPSTREIVISSGLGAVGGAGFLTASFVHWPRDVGHLPLLLPTGLIVLGLSMAFDGFFGSSRVFALLGAAVAIVTATGIAGWWAYLGWGVAGSAFAAALVSRRGVHGWSVTLAALLPIALPLFGAPDWSTYVGSVGSGYLYVLVALPVVALLAQVAVAAMHLRLYGGYYLVMAASTMAMIVTMVTFQVSERQMMASTYSLLTLAAIAGVIAEVRTPRTNAPSAS